MIEEVSIKVQVVLMSQLMHETLGTNRIAMPPVLGGVISKLTLSIILQRVFIEFVKLVEEF